MKFPEVLAAAGETGWFQFSIFMLLGVVNIYTNLQTLAVNLLSPYYPHWCDVPSLANLSATDQRQLAVPSEPGTRFGYDTCQVYDFDWDTFEPAYDENGTIVYPPEKLDGTKPCPYDYVFEEGEYGRTATSEWELVCERSNLLALVSPVFTIGLFLGSIFGGLVSDRFGRRLAIVVFTLLHVLAGVASALAVNEWMYMIARLLVGFAVRGTGISGSVLLMEFVAARHRVAAVVGYQVFYGIGGLVLVAFGYWIRDFRYLQLAALVPVLLMLSYWWLLPESPVWLLSRGRAEEAGAVLRTIARRNGRTLPENMIQDFVQTFKESLEAKNNTKPAGFADLFKEPTVRKYSLVCDVLLMSALFISLGVSYNLNQLFGDIYTNLVISSAMEMPAYVLLFFALTYLGRKATFIITFSLASIFCFVAVPMVTISGLEMGATVLSILARVNGSCGIAIMGIWIGEMFPTSIRQLALGSAHGFAAAVCVASPYVGGPLQEVWLGLPNVVFGCIAVLGSALALILPETLNHPLPETVEDVCNLKQRRKPTIPMGTPAAVTSDNQHKAGEPSIKHVEVVESTAFGDNATSPNHSKDPDVANVIVGNDVAQEYNHTNGMTNFAYVSSCEEISRL